MKRSARNKGHESAFNNISFVDKTELLVSKRPQIRYEKLAVPTRMRSVYWKYFGFPSDGDGSIITKDVIFCVLCKSQMVYNRNTSNLKMHLGSRHKDVLSSLEPNGEMNVAKIAKIENVFCDNIDGNYEYSETSTDLANSPSRKTVHVDVCEDVNESDLSNIDVIFPNNDGPVEYSDSRMTNEPFECAEINNSIINFIISDMVSPDIVEGSGFHDLISKLSNYSLIIPNKKKFIEDILPTMHNTYKERIFNDIGFGDISNVSLAVEEWKCVDNVKCLSFYLHYLKNGSPMLHTKLLKTVSFTGCETVQYWNNYVTNLLDEYHINCNLMSAALMASDNKELKESLETKNITVLPCFLFSLQKLCSEHCFNRPEVSILLEKSRGVIKFLLEGSVHFEENQNELEENYDENETYTFSYDRPEMWLTTYYMLKGLIMRKEVIEEYLRIRSFENSLDSMEWKKIQDLLTLLEPLKTITLTLLEEKNPLISLSKPLVWRVTTSKFGAAKHDSAFVQKIKTIIKNKLNQVYSAEHAGKFTRIATALDPRFKEYVQQDETNNSEDCLKDLLMQLVKKEGLYSVGTSEKNESKKQNRLSGINALFGDSRVNKSSSTTEGKVQAEISLYNAENIASLEDCPLEWWENNNKKCPNLIRLARKYHCVPATVILNGNNNIKNYVSFCDKRAALRMNVVGPLLFMNLNKISL